MGQLICPFGFFNWCQPQREGFLTRDGDCKHYGLAYTFYIAARPEGP